MRQGDEMKVDYEAAWERYYVLADRRNKEGLTALQVRSIVDAALVGSRVAGRDDLLIRREDIDYEAALQEWEFDVHRMFDTEGAYDDEGWLLARLTRCINTALAAAEGGET